MANLCFTVAILCALYYLGIIVYSGIYTDFSWIWPVGVVFLGGNGLLFIINKKNPDLFPVWIKYTYSILIFSCICFFFMLFLKVLSAMKGKGRENLDYVVVLGAHVKGELPSKALLKRLEAALDYGEKNPETKLVLSGGQGFGENITEALCMKRYLVKNGISSDRLILEEKSTDTRENLKFSDEMTGCKEKKTGILSNDFHVYRAVRLAKKLGYVSPEGIAAQSDPFMEPHYIVREIFALVKEQLKGNI